MTPRVTVNPSMRLTLLLIMLHFGGLCSLFFLIIPKLIIWILTIFIGVNLYLTLQKFALLQSPESIIKIDLINSEENTWQWLTKNQEKLLGNLRHDTYFSKYLIVLRMNLVRSQLVDCSYPRLSQRIYSTVLSSDAVNVNDWRQLQIMLRNFKVK